jgi:hypothetical protein
MKLLCRLSGGAILAVSLSACGHAPPAEKSAGPTDGSAQREIASLEKRIVELKPSLDGPTMGSPGGYPPAGGAMSPGSSATPRADGLPGGGRCDGVCQAAQEICTRYRRICRLAEKINDDKSAESCRRSQRDCEEAGRYCATCR